MLFLRQLILPTPDQDQCLWLQGFQLWWKYFSMTFLNPWCGNSTLVFLLLVFTKQKFHTNTKKDIFKIFRKHAKKFSSCHTFFTLLNLKKAPSSVGATVVSGLTTPLFNPPPPVVLVTLTPLPVKMSAPSLGECHPPLWLATPSPQPHCTAAAKYLVFVAKDLVFRMFLLTFPNSVKQSSFPD